MNFGVKNALGFAEGFRDKYERNGKAVDAELRAESPPLPLLKHLSEEQMRVAQNCLALETASATAEWKKLTSPSPFVEFAMKYSKPIGGESRCAPPHSARAKRSQKGVSFSGAPTARQQPTLARVANNRRSRGAPTTDAREARQQPPLAPGANNLLRLRSIHSRATTSFSSRFARPSPLTPPRAPP
jgi:hypothetical protein